MSQVDLTDIKQDGVKGSEVFDSLFAENDEQVKETPVESSPDKKQEEETPSQKGDTSKKDSTTLEDENTSDVNQNIPLNKDKRWKEMREALKERDLRIEEMSKKQEAQMTELKSLIANGQVQSNKVPKVFSELFGTESEDLWNKYMELNKASVPQIDKESLKKELFQEWENKQKEERQQEQKQLQWVDGEIVKLRDEGLKFEKNELLAVLDKYRPTDDQGFIDFKKGYEILEALNANKPQNQRKQIRKEMATKTMPSGNVEQADSDTVDLAKIRGKHWSQIVKY